MTFFVTSEHEGMSVLHILQKQLALSGGMIRHLKFLDDGILLNGERVTVRGIVHEGDILELDTSEREYGSKIAPIDLNLRIAYEDGDIVVPDKSAFMPTHPSHDHYDDTVANALAYRYRDAAESFVFRPVNRLDRNTSGLLIIARNRISAGRLTKSMQEKKIQKRYIAILDGVLADDSGIIETYMRRTRESIIVREVCEKEEGADFALTEYRVICRSDKHTMVLAEPKTGRTHQLRVHFASLGCPITGDDLYGEESENISRHALHAYQLRFPHPSRDEIIDIKAPLHDDMRALAEKLFDREDIDDEIEKKIAEEYRVQRRKC